MNSLSPILAAFLLKSGEDQSPLERDLKQIISALSFRLLLGFILTSILITSIIHFSNIFLLWLNKFEYALEWKIGILISVITLNFIFLIFLFRGTSTKHQLNKTKNPLALPIIDIPPLAFQLYTGILEGMKAGTKK